MCTWSQRTHKPRRAEAAALTSYLFMRKSFRVAVHCAISYFLEHRSISVWTLKYAMVVFTFRSSRISMVSRKHIIFHLSHLPECTVKCPEQRTSQWFYYLFFTEQNTVGRLPQGHLGQCDILNILPLGNTVFQWSYKRSHLLSPSYTRATGKFSFVRTNASG